MNNELKTMNHLANEPVKRLPTLPIKQLSNQSIMTNYAKQTQFGKGSNVHKVFSYSRL
jgi:hypothetical protein